MRVRGRILEKGGCPPALAFESVPPTADVLLQAAAHELCTPLNAIGGFTELALAGDLGPLSGQLREALLAVAQAARTLEATAETILACRHAMPYGPRPVARVDLTTVLARAGFEVIAPESQGWPTVSADAERVAAGLQATRRWLGRRRSPDGQARARLGGGVPAASCVLAPVGPPRPDEGLGGLDLLLARALLAADGLDLRPTGRDLELVWPDRALDPLARRASGANFSA